MITRTCAWRCFFFVSFNTRNVASHRTVNSNRCKNSSISKKMRFHLEATGVSILKSSNASHEAAARHISADSAAVKPLLKMYRYIWWIFHTESISSQTLSCPVVKLPLSPLQGSWMWACFSHMWTFSRFWSEVNLNPKHVIRITPAANTENAGLVLGLQSPQRLQLISLTHSLKWHGWQGRRAASIPSLRGKPVQTGGLKGGEEGQWWCRQRTEEERRCFCHADSPDTKIKKQTKRKTLTEKKQTAVQNHRLYMRVGPSKCDYI